MIRVKKRILLFIFLTSPLFLFPQMKKWVLGKSQWDQGESSPNTAQQGFLQFFEADFSSTQPVFTERPLGNSLENLISAGVNEGMISATDDSGNIAFYAFPNVVIPYNNGSRDTLYLVAFDPSTGKDEVFAKIDPESVCGNSIKETDIVKVDGVSNLYYFIYKTACINNFPNDSWKYVIVDLNSKSISKPFTIMSGTLNEGLAVSPFNCVMSNRWLFFVKYDNGNLLVYRSSITATGIAAPVLAASLIIPGNYSLGQGDIEISPLVDKIAIANFSTGNLKEDIAILDLDIATGVLSNLRWIDSPENYMITLEFSPDGKRLYSFRGGTSAITASMFNIPVPANGNYTILPSDLVNVPIKAAHSIEVGFDGQLYFTTTHFNTKLYYISNPNAAAGDNIINTTPNFSFGPGNGISLALPDQIDGNGKFGSPISVKTKDTTICPGQSVILTANGATVYQWSGGITSTNASIQVTPTVTTTYFLKASNACLELLDTIVITVAEPQVTIPGNRTICKGETITLTANGGIQYQWSGGITSTNASIQVAPTATTTYFLKTRTSCNERLDTIIIIVRDSKITVTGNTTICRGETTTLTATGGIQYQWSGGIVATTPSVTVSPVVSTTYSVVVFDGTCYSQPIPTTVTVNLNPIVTIIGKDTLCAGDTLPYQAITNGASPFTYVWTNGSSSSTTLFSTLSATSLSVKISDKNGCKGSATISIHVEKKPEALFNADFQGCTPLEIKLSNHSLHASSYYWILGDGTLSGLTTPDHIYTTPGKYSISLIAKNNFCPDADTLTIKNAAFAFPVPAADISYSMTTNEKQIEIVNLSKQGDSCTLHYGDGDFLNGCGWQKMIHNYLSDGEYIIRQIVSNVYGCRDTALIKINLETEGDLYYPNCFTPDGDGLNDTFLTYGFNVEEFKMSIFNRWGQLLFQSDSIYKSWDGTYKGQTVEQDVYVLKLDYRLKKGRTKTIYGHITLVK